MADKRAGEVNASFRDMGFIVRADKTRKNETGTEKGRSDVVLMRAGVGCFVETKNADMGFNVNKWTPQQRRWGRMAQHDNGSDYYVLLLVGKHPPHYNPAKYSPRRAFCVPFDAFYEAVAQVRLFQRSIPYKLSKKTKKKDMLARGLDCLTLFKEYEMTWQKGVWQFSDDHVFSQKYLRGKQPNGSDQDRSEGSQRQLDSGRVGSDPGSAGEEGGQDTGGEAAAAA